jgi:DNA-binding XRE family transcriptional regulator
LSEIESGKKTPSIDLVDKYSSFFRIPASSLLYFSEQLEKDNFTERARVSIAKKIIKIMNWVSDTEDIRDALSKKPT